MKIVRSVIYKLKHAFGVSADLYLVTVGETNYATGVKSTTRTRFQINRMVLIPERTDFKVDYNGVNTVFKYGGVFEVGDREIIIDYRDLPHDFVLLPNAYIVFNGQRYDFVRWYPLDHKAGYYAIVRRTQTSVEVDYESMTWDEYMLLPSWIMMEYTI